MFMLLPCYHTLFGKLTCYADEVTLIERGGQIVLRLNAFDSVAHLVPADDLR